VLQRVAVRCSVLHLHSRFSLIKKMLVRCSALKCVAVRCSAMQRVTLTLEVQVN